jgi:hypothetical protein
MGSIAPITATQFGTNRIAEQWLRGLRRRPSTSTDNSSTAELSGVDRFACAAVAGGVSAAVATPTELIIIQQQKHCAPLAATVRGFASRYSAPSLFRGLGPCVGRETLYAAGYLGLCPVLYDALRAREDPLPAPQAMAVAGVVGGVFAAAASHPFDTSEFSGRSSLSGARPLPFLLLSSRLFHRLRLPPPKQNNSQNPHAGAHVR